MGQTTLIEANKITLKKDYISFCKTFFNVHFFT